MLVENLDKDKRQELDDLLDEPPVGRDSNNRPVWTSREDDFEMSLADLAQLEKDFGRISRER